MIMINLAFFMNLFILADFPQKFYFFQKSTKIHAQIKNVYRFFIIYTTTNRIRAENIRY